MIRYNDQIEILKLWNSHGLASVCGTIRSPRFTRPHLFSIRWNGWEHTIPNGWTLRGFLFQGNHVFPTWQDALSYVERYVEP